MILNCIIVDDEPLALDILEDYVRRTPTLSLSGRFSGSADALSVLEKGDVDLAFFDIQMPGMNGLELAKKIGSKNGADFGSIFSAKTGSKTRVIFTTAFPQYAVDGFRVDALDYLLKPVSFDEFSRAVARATEWFETKKRASSNTLSNDGKQPVNLIVKSDYKQMVIPIETIVYIEGIRDYIRIHTTGENGSVQTLMNMKKVEEMLPAGRFTRVHRSYIVNLDSVKKIERGGIVLGGTGVGDLFGEVSIPVSDTYRDAFLQSLSARSL